MTKREFLKIALKAVDDETELSEDPPEGFLENLLEDNDPELLAFTFRALIQQTKESIAKRIEKRLEAEPSLSTWPIGDSSD